MYKGVNINDITVVINNLLPDNQILKHDECIMVNDYTAELIRITQVNIIRKKKFKKILKNN